MSIEQLMGIPFSQLFDIDPCDAEPTAEDLEDLAVMEEDADVIDEWNAYYMSSRL